MAPSRHAVLVDCSDFSAFLHLTLRRQQRGLATGGKLRVATRRAPHSLLLPHSSLAAQHTTPLPFPLAAPLALTAPHRAAALSLPVWLVLCSSRVSPGRRLPACTRTRTAVYGSKVEEDRGARQATREWPCRPRQTHRQAEEQPGPQCQRPQWEDYGTAQAPAWPCSRQQ